MRAPTPVRSLVHRSTLVTAGLFLLFIFNYLLFFNILINILFLLRFFTILFSNLLSLYEKDLKKIIALRTLSQIGFCIFSLIFSFTFLCFFHIIRHALFKSCLFIQIGYLIYFYYGQQDMRGFIFTIITYNILCFQFLGCLFSLCGVFFSGGIISKDYIIELIFFFNFSFFIFLLFLLII
jgi:NADH:ubiquinone oxidoreductase subunit 5 (subunit L)/multisubunit Na+/H+ antiporter MnhA subunit